MLTIERLKELFTYNPETGVFRNRTSRGRADIGGIAGSPAGHGYRKITIDYAKYYEHHLAWYYVYGEWPDEIDHKDRVRDNNAISNLRKTTRTGNCCNTERTTGSSGLRGAYLDKRTMQWYSKIQIGCQVVYLGAFDSAIEANAAYIEAVKLHHGEFALL